MSDELIAGQPSFSAEYMRKVWDLQPTLMPLTEHFSPFNRMGIKRAVVLQMLDYNVPGGKLNRGLAVGDILGHLKQEVLHYLCAYIYAKMYQLCLTPGLQSAYNLLIFWLRLQKCDWHRCR